MSKILITGASGFVGSFLVEEALSRGLDVYAGIRSTSSRKWLQDPKINFIELNLSDRDSLQHDIRQHQFDYIIHNAGLTKANKIADLFKVNADYSHNLAQAALASQHLKKFSFMSSLAAYGTADYQESKVVAPDSPPRPITSYGKSKLRAEEKLLDISDLPLMIFRPTGIFGPREGDFLQVFKSIKSGIALQVGMSEQWLTLIYVKDLVRVILDATLSTQADRAYFVSDGNLYRGSEFNSLIAKHLGKSPFHLKVPLPIVSAIATITDISSRITGQSNILSRDKLPEIKSRSMDCDISNLVQDHNFRPLYTLDQAIAETADWYTNNGWI